MSRVSRVSLSSPALWRVTLVGALTACVAVLSTVAAAHAEVRQDVLVDLTPDVEQVLTDFDATVRNDGLQVYLAYDQTSTVQHNGVTLTFRQIEYSVSDYNGTRSATATFFVLAEPDEDTLDALKAYVAYNHSYGGNVVYRIRGLGVLNWYEWGPMGASTEMIDNQLADWREQYLESP